MRSFLPTPLLLSVLAAVVLPAHAQDPDAGLNKSINYELRNATTDDELIGMARAADINLIADATQMPQEKMVTPSRWPDGSRWALYILLHDISLGRHLSWRPGAQSGTILLWNQPDMAILARQIATSDIQRAPCKLDQKAFAVALIDYLRDVQKWDSTKEFSKDILISDLPPQLRDEMVAVAQNSVLNDPLFGLQSAKAALSDDSWKTARIQLAKAGSDLPAVETLNLTKAIPSDTGLRMTQTLTLAIVRPAK